jgi:hypothetical protein
MSVVASRPALSAGGETTMALVAATRRVERRPAAVADDPGRDLARAE